MKRKRTIKRKAKRLVAALLLVTITLSYHVQGLAASQKQSSNQSMIVGKDREEMEEKRKNEWKKSSPLYNQLNRTSGEAKETSASLAEEGKDWASEYRKKVAEEGLKEGLDAIKDAARDKTHHLFRGSPNYHDTKGALTDLADCIEDIGSFLGVTDAIFMLPEVLNLQGDTVEEQLMELTVLTAEFGFAAFSVIGMSIGFPFGLILSLVLDLILDMIRNGVFDGLTLSDNLLDKEEFDRQRYKLPDGTNVYKPNIYIYSQEERQVTVTFGEPELLTVTAPEYGDGWNVTAGEDGRLVDGDGRAYDYLFYESVTEPSIFQKRSGWQIAAKERRERFQEILAEIGFNEREIKDFTDFWTEKLEAGTDYIMYPQKTELVDLAMPVTIEEEPKSLERIWFVFVKDDGRQVEEPKGYALSRGGEDCSYYVIEWGGLEN